MNLNKYENFFGDSAEKEKNIEDWNDFDFVLSKVKQKGWSLYDASKKLTNNEKIVLEAVKQDGLALEFASKRLQDNEEIVQEAINQNVIALKYASYNFQKEFLYK